MVLEANMGGAFVLPKAGRRWSRVVFFGLTISLATAAGLLSLRTAMPVATNPKPPASTTPSDISEDAKLPPRAHEFHLVRAGEPGRPDVRVWEKGEGASPAEDFAKRALVPLTPEEEDVLRMHQSEELGGMIAQAMTDYNHADDAHRAEADRRYLLLLNLSAKFDSYSVSPRPEEVEFQREYLRDSAGKLAEWRTLPQEERSARLSKFKDDLFARRVEPVKGKP